VTVHDHVERPADLEANGAAEARACENVLTHGGIVAEDAAGR
jgi:hypothetical protein